MVNHKRKPEEIERVTLKLPKEVAEYFRSAFPHGKRSDFVTDCLLEHRHREEIRAIEQELREIGKKRQ